MATSAPIIIIQTGRFEGRLKPSRSPVSRAEPSVMVNLSCLSKNFEINHSKKRQEATLVVSTTAAPNPKKYKLAMSAGSKAMHTPYMFFLTLSPE
jgi:hypothetical protein